MLVISVLVQPDLVELAPRLGAYDLLVPIAGGAMLAARAIPFSMASYRLAEGPWLLLSEVMSLLLTLTSAI